MFDLLVKDIASRFNLGTGAVSTLVRELLALISDARTGGIHGLVDRFRQAGLGDTVSSWLGGKSDTPLPASQLESTLGPSTIDRMASVSGISRMAAPSVIAALLPKVIALLSPAGALPSNNALLSQVSGFLSRPSAAAESVVKEKRGFPSWLPWAALAALALLAWMWLGAPAGKP